MALETRPYGKTGEKVSAIGLGGAFLDPSSIADGIATVRRALELGVSYFDTSPGYGWASQVVMGEGLKSWDGPYLLATKLGYMQTPRDHRSRDALRAQLWETLRALQRDQVDVLQVHQAGKHEWWTDDVPLLSSTRGRPQEPKTLHPDYDFTGAPVMQVLREARADGLCRFIGVTSDLASKDIALLLEHLDVDTCLPAFDYDILRRYARLDVLPVAVAKGVAVILGGIFRCGEMVEVHPEWLTSPPTRITPELRDGLERLYSIQRECSLPLVELTIRYLLADRDISTILVGATTPAEIEESVAAAEKGPLPSDLHQALEDLGVPKTP